MKVNIEYLVDRPDTIEILASWLFREWSHRSPDGTARGMMDVLKGRLNRDKLPLALVAVRGNEPLGTVSLKPKEVEVRPQYKHWLGTLYVQEAYRGQGIGSLLIKTAARVGARLGIGDFYLYTRRPENEKFYAKLGWAVVERLEYEGRQAVIMRKILSE